MDKVEFEVNQVLSSAMPIVYDETRCVSCNRCVNACQCDVLFPNERGITPIVMFPGECYYCGACVMVCPKDAIQLKHPIMNQAKFVEIEK